ncbi:MAG: iron-containing alcohol dehydrogenase [bacterium]
MENFISYNPTVLHFGRNILSSLGPTLKEFGSKVLLVYGKGSIKRNGLYGKIKNILAENGMEVFEYEGIRPNPLNRDVDAAAAIGRENKVDVILAVGGGSVIDSAKIISITIPVQNPSWDFFTYAAKPEKAIPLVAVLTLAATGTEMNPFAVLQNPDTGVKAGYRSTLTFPRHSFLDPELTFSVPKDYTAYGIADLIAHCLENYFSVAESTLTDRFILSIISEAMTYGPALLDDLQNYDLRAKIMFSATMALNGLTSLGKNTGDWGVHSAGHVLSFMYDIPHGASLTIIFPAWMKLFRDQIPGRIASLGSALFQKSLTPQESIDQIENFFRSIGCPVRLSEYGITGDVRREIFNSMVANKVNGALMKFREEDYLKLIDLFL